MPVAWAVDIRYVMRRRIVPSLEGVTHPIGEGSGLKPSCIGSPIQGLGRPLLPPSRPSGDGVLLFSPRSSIHTPGLYGDDFYEDPVGEGSGAEEVDYAVAGEASEHDAGFGGLGRGGG